MFFPRKFPSAIFTSPENARVLSLCLSALIFALWLWLFRGMSDYLGVIAVREDFRTNQLVLLGTAALIVYQVRSKQWQLQVHAAPRLNPLPLALALGGAIAYLLIEHFLDINTIAAILFGVATYGLVGLWLTPASWRGGLPAALLLIGVLPFGEHMQTFIGYPMRVLTVETVRAGLALAGIQPGGLDTILILENGIAQVDLPCSGVKSLWTGTLFLLAATWLDRRAVNARWLGVALGLTLLLFAANVLRVGALVVSAQALNLPVLAQMLHVPLGVLGFVGACAAAVVGLRFCKSVRLAQPQTENIPPPRVGLRRRWRLRLSSCRRCMCRARKMV